MGKIETDAGVIDTSDFQYNKDQLDAMEIDDVQYLRDEIELEAANIQFQLDQAESKLAATGEHADYEWYNKAKFALKVKRHQVNRLDRYMANRRREWNQAESESFERHFVNAARDFMAEDDFGELIQVAAERAKNEMDQVAI